MKVICKNQIPKINITQESLNEEGFLLYIGAHETATHDGHYIDN